MQEEKDSRCFDREFSFVAAFIDLSLEYKEKTASMTGVHTRYSEIVADVLVDMEQRAWVEDGLRSLESRAR